MKKCNTTQLAVLIAIVSTALLATGCADTVTFTEAANAEPVGFWHGMIAPFAWIVSLFSDSTSVYAIYNNGGWYDFGFMVGIGALSSSASSSRK